LNDPCEVTPADEPELGGASRAGRE
jgi:hypothetical protein